MIKDLCNDLLLDLNNSDKKYKELHNAIINNFDVMYMSDYVSMLRDGDIRVYNGIDTDVVIDSWFHTQNIYSGEYGEVPTVEVNENTFTIIPPSLYKECYENYKMTYDNTLEGLENAFFNTQADESVTKVSVEGIDYYICVSLM